MLRIALALALGFAAITLAGTTVSVRAQDKKDEKKKLEGTLTCTKCALGETDKCGNALVVKEGDKKITYYIKDKGAGEKYHACKKDVDAVVTGKVVEKDKKKYIEDAKVEKK
jgi:hypothetical protein